MFMSERRKRTGNRSARRGRDSIQPLPLDDADGSARDAFFRQAGSLVTDEVFPAIEAFRGYMLEQNRKLQVTPFLDHIEGPQVVVHISRPDGRIAATLIAEITPEGIQPFWDVTSTGRFKTHWTEIVPGGPAGLTRDYVLQKLTEFYNTDFS
jgi:hypothetical protein